MGSGKTTLGRCLAARLGWHFRDLDERIEAAAGLPIPEIFARRGEGGFRTLEREQLELIFAAAAGRRMVVALGGGTFAQPLNCDHLLAAGGCVVFLDVALEELLLRCAQVTNRPLFRDEASFRELYARRLPFYRRAQVTVSVAAGAAESPEGLADRLLERVYEWAAHSAVPPRPSPSLQP